MRGAQNYVRRYYYRDLMSGASQLLATGGRIVLGAMAWNVIPTTKFWRTSFSVRLSERRRSFCMFVVGGPTQGKVNCRKQCGAVVSPTGCGVRGWHLKRDHGDALRFDVASK